MLAGSTHAHPHRVHMHACTGPMHACSHWVPMPTHSQGLAHSHQVPTPAWSPYMHAPGPHACLLVGSLRKHAPGHACMLALGHICTLAPGPHTCLVSMHACTGPMCTCLHRAPTPTWSPCTHASGPCTHAHSRSPRPLACGVPMHACTGPMHACSTGPMHTHSHQAYALTLTPGLYMCTHTGPPCLLVCGVPMYVRQIPALVHAASHIVCSSSYM